MADKCVFCKDEIESPYPPRLQENKMFMFEILMEQTTFDKELLVNAPLCEDCDKSILNFFNFKSSFMETEDEFINYMDGDNKVDLYDVLVKTYKLKRFENENVPIKVCRICFKATQVEEYKEIKSLGSKLAMVVTTCLPEFNIKLTEHTYLCSKCNSAILQHYHFLLLCSEAAASKEKSIVKNSDPAAASDPLLMTKTSSEVSDTLMGERDSSEVSNFMLIEEAHSEASKPSVKQKASSEASDPLAMDDAEPKNKRPKLRKDISNEQEPSSSSLLLPLVVPKRRPGRPRRGEIVIKSISLRKRGRPQQNPPKEKKDETVEKIFVFGQELPGETKNATVDSYECQVCPEIVHDLESLKKHLTGHEKEKDFFCWQCGYVCYNFGALCTHYVKHKTGLFKVVKKRVTGKTLRKIMEEKTKNDTSTKNDNAEPEDNLYTVQRTDICIPSDIKKKRGRKRKKPYSPANTSGKLIIESNVVRKEKPAEPINKDPSFECQICPGIFDSMVELQEHIKFHQKQSQIVCWRCGAWFLEFQSLKKHFKSHGLTDLYKVVDPKKNQSSEKAENTLPSSVTKPQTARRKSPSPPPDPASIIPCPRCTRSFNRLDDYMNHSCEGRKTEEPKQDLKKQEFSCGHCSSVFYSLDDLDEHNCMATLSAGDSTKNGVDPLRIGGKIDTYKVPTPKAAFPSPPLTQPAFKITEADYQCSYCVQTFNTISALDNHTCKEEPSPPLKICHHPEVKKESLFECSYCVSLFETAFELSEHKCSSMPPSGNIFANSFVNSSSAEGGTGCVDAGSTGNSVGSANINAGCASNETFSTETEVLSVGNDLGLLIKTDPDFDSFLAAPGDLGEKQIPSDELLREPQIKAENPDERLNGRNVENPQESKSPKEMSLDDKKNAINKIANIFGVKIVEGKDNGKGGDSKLNCIGCDFIGVDRKDLMFHAGFCDKVLRCNFCSYTTNIPQKLEVHTWSIHNTIVFTCSYCQYITSMEENFAAHILTHNEFHSDTILNGTFDADEEDCQNDVSNDASDDVLCISDDNDETFAATESLSDRNSLPDSSVNALNRWINFHNFKNGSEYVSEEGLQNINEQRKDCELDKTEPSRKDIPLENESTTSALTNDDNFWPTDSDDEVDDSEAFKILRQPSKKDADNIEQNSIDTEPVWLVKSAAIKENLSQTKMVQEGLAPEGEREANSVDQNTIELIIPDRIIPEPPSIETGPFSDPLNSVNDRIETVKSETSPETPPLEASTKNSETLPGKSLGYLEKSKSSADTTEQSVIYINDDSDSDSEFFEPNQSLISTVAGCEVVNISASEASKLISEGIPVVTESSLVAMQMESSPNEAKAVASESARDRPSTSLESGPLIIQQRPGEAGLIDFSVNSVTSTEKCAKDNNDKEPQISSGNEDVLQPEYAKEPSSDNVEQVDVVAEQNDAPNEKTSKDSKDVVSKEVSTNSKSKYRVIIERGIEGEANSDSSSFFVTDNEDSDTEENDKSKTTTISLTFNSFSNTQAEVEEKASRPEKIVEKPFLPIDINDGVLISDEDDAKEEVVPEQASAISKSIETNKKVPAVQTTKKSLPVSTKPQPKKTREASMKSYSKNKNAFKNKPVNASTVSTDDSFVISDDEDGVGKTAEKEKGSSAAKASQIVVVPKTSSTRRGVLRKAVMPTRTKPPIVTYSRTFRFDSKTCKNVEEKAIGAKEATKSRVITSTSSGIETNAVRKNPLSKEILKSPAICSTSSKISIAQDSSIMTNRVPQEPAKPPDLATSDGSSCVVIDDDNEDADKANISSNTEGVSADKEDISADKVEEPTSRNDSSSLDVILDRDFSLEVEGESSQEADSGDDCVFVAEVDGVQQSKNLGSSSTITTTVKKAGGPVKKLPTRGVTALHVFISKVRAGIEQKYPGLAWGEQKRIILDAWRNMSNEDRWPFKEEARLHRILFRREHPEVAMYKKRVKKTPSVRKVTVTTTKDIEEIVLD